MALPPGYLQLFAAAIETRVPLSVEQCVALEDSMVAAGWVITPGWTVRDDIHPGVVVEGERT
jgi:hypothetical protein